MSNLNLFQAQTVPGSTQAKFHLPAPALRQPALLRRANRGLSAMERAAVFSDDDQPVEWSEEEVVLLHWRLLLELRHLSDPDTPLEEKLDTLRWVFSDPDKEDMPFSFVSCVRVASSSPLSPAPYFGRIDVDSIRNWVRHQAKAWLRATINRYPPSIGAVVLGNPEWVERQLAKNPQWLNEEAKKYTADGDLFT